MTDPIKRYRRPDQQWKCGLQDQGVLCNSGPDHLHRCSNPNADQMCHPRRTLIWWRRYLPVAFATITLAVLIAIANMPSHRAIIAPGPLTMAHAQLISDPQDPHRCAACHSDGQATDLPIDQLSEAVLAKHSQSERCISCHSRDMPHLAIRSAHDLPVEVLAEMTAWVKNKKSNPEPMALATGDARSNLVNINAKTDKTTEAGSANNNTSQDLACSTCHREHQGPDHDLQAIASSRCQACHQESFKSFSDGHPQFDNYPSKQRSKIAFDHRKHQDTHFTKSSTQFDCRSCHVDEEARSNVGKVFRSLPFESACAKCHDASIKSSMSEGAIVFQVPSMDVEGLAKKRVNISQWPEEASLMLDGKIPALMQWLLLGEPEGALALSNMSPDADLSKLRLESEADQKSLLSLAIASKRILERVGNAGQSAFVDRFVSSGGDHQVKPFDIGIQEILRGAPPDLFRTGFENWFSSQAQAGKQWKLLKPGTHLNHGGWMIDRNRLSISYVPTGHADLWLSSILESASDVIESEGRISGVMQEPKNTRMVSIAKQLLSPQSIGRCAECHTDITHKKPFETLVSSRSDSHESLKQNSKDRWRSERMSAAVRSLTKFDHGPHLIQPQLHSCVACHSLNSNMNSAMNSAGRLDREFASIRVEQCSSCHRPQAAGDNCTQCHNYHASQR